MDITLYLPIFWIVCTGINFYVHIKVEGQYRDLTLFDALVCALMGPVGAVIFLLYKLMTTVIYRSPKRSTKSHVFNRPRS